MLTYAHVYLRILTYAHVCWHVSESAMTLVKQRCELNVGSRVLFLSRQMCFFSLVKALTDGWIFVFSLVSRLSSVILTDGRVIFGAWGGASVLCLQSDFKKEKTTKWKLRAVRAEVSLRRQRRERHLRSHCHTCPSPHPPSSPCPPPTQCSTLNESSVK
jgi:hypothetical protein